MGILDGLGNIIGGVLTLSPGKIGEGVADLVKTPFDMAQSALMSGGSQSLTGGGAQNSSYGGDVGGQF